MYVKHVLQSTVSRYICVGRGESKVSGSSFGVYDVYMFTRPVRARVECCEIFRNSSVCDLLH